MRHNHSNHPGTVPTAQVGEMIQQAEIHLAAHDFGPAQDCLAEAWRLDPGNPYIPAIAERIEILQSMMRHDSSKRNPPAEPMRYLEVSVGKEFPEGIRPAATQAAPISQEDRQARIHRLTTVALSLLERGSVEPAFQSFMKAYVIDPMSPDIISCANRVLPAWEALIGKSGPFRSESQPRRPDVAGAAAAEAQRIVAGEHGADRKLPAGNKGPGTHEERVLAMKRRREMERGTSDQAAWSAASKLPQTSGTSRRDVRTSSATSSASKEQKGGFLSPWVRRVSSE
jgi:hypothetical protein